MAKVPVTPDLLDELDKIAGPYKYEVGHELLEARREALIEYFGSLVSSSTETVIETIDN